MRTPSQSGTTPWQACGSWPCWFNNGLSKGSKARATSMKAFAFRLEKVLRWREANVELEQFKLSRLAAECAQWDRLLAQLDEARCQAEKTVLASGSVGGGELGALARFKESLRQQKQTAVGRR